MIDISRGKTQQVWRNVKANSIIPPDRVDAFAANYQQHMAQTIQYWGQPLGVELVGQEAFGRSLLRVTYLLKYNVSGIAWYFYFYRLKDRWIISEFNFDLNSNSLFQTVNNGGDKETASMTFLAWQEAVEKKLAALEDNVNSAAPSDAAVVEADPPVVESDPIHDPIIVRQDLMLAGLAERLAILEVKANQPGPASNSDEPSPALEQSNPSSQNEPGMLSESSQSQVEIISALQLQVKQLEAQVASFESTAAELQAIDGKLDSLDDTLHLITKEIDLQELARIGVVIKALKKQHPYLEIPGETSE